MSPKDSSKRIALGENECQFVSTSVLLSAASFKLKKIWLPRIQRIDGFPRYSYTVISARLYVFGTDSLTIMMLSVATSRTL